MTLTAYLAQHYTTATARVYAFEIEHYLVYLGGEERALSVGYSDVVSYLIYLRKRYGHAASSEE